MVFQSECGGRVGILCELASSSLCRLYLHSAGLFSPLMTATISRGASWGCFSKLYFWFWLSLAWLGIWRNKKQKQNAQTQEYRALLKAGAGKLMSTVQVLDSGIPGCSGHQLVSWWYLCSLAWLKPWFLPNYQGNDFFLCLLKNFSVHPVHYLFTHSRSISWEAAVDWNLGLESILCHYLMSHPRQDTTSLDFYFTNLKSKF